MNGLRPREFYTEYEQHGGSMIIPTEIFDELYDDATEEIERLKEQLNDEIDDELKQSEIMVKQQNGIERQKEIIRELDIKNLELTTVIKEVREYIDYYGITPEQNDDVMVRHILKGILEILDKENI